jgi:hypothetical protein
MRWDHWQQHNNIVMMVTRTLNRNIIIVRPTGGARLLTHHPGGPWLQITWYASVQRMQVSNSGKGPVTYATCTSYNASIVRSHMHSSQTTTHHASLLLRTLCNRNPPCQEYMIRPVRCHHKAAAKPKPIPTTRPNLKPSGHSLRTMHPY